MTVRRRKNIERILVIQTAFLGDIVLVTPLLAALRQEFPTAEILFLTTIGGAALLENNPWNVHCSIFDKRGKDKGPQGFFRKRKELHAFRADVVFCLHRSLRSTLLAHALKVETWGFREGALSFLFEGRVSRKGKIFEAEKNLSLLQAFLRARGNSVLSYSPIPHLAFAEKDRERSQDLARKVQPYIVIAPSSVWATKRWPMENFAQLALQFLRKKNIQTILIGGGEGVDKAIAHQVRNSFLEACTPSERGLAPLDLAGQTSLGVLKALLSRAKLVISNDSSPLHIAIAVGAPVHAIFGPTTKKLGFFPLAPDGRAGVSEVEGLDCRPCGLHGHSVCPKGHFRCMLDLSVDQVYREAETLLSGRS